MGAIFAAFVMGVGLMGGLWCIYNHTGNEISFLPLLNSYGTTIQYNLKAKFPQIKFYIFKYIVIY